MLWFALAVIVILVIAFFVFRYMNKVTYEDSPQPKPILGTGNIKILEYADLQCPACKSMHPILKKIMDEYDGDVTFEFKHFPLTTIHLNSMAAAEASECANDQNKFFEFVDMAYERQEEFENGISSGKAKDVFKSIAIDLGLDKSFNDCIDSGIKSSYVKLESSEANDLKLSGTPSIFINGQKIDNSYNDIVDAIKKAINSTK